MAEIRRAGKADILKLAHGVFDAYRVFYKQTSDPVGAEKFLEERMEMEQSVIFVAEIDGEIVGFTQIYPLYSSVRMKRLLQLNDLFVGVEYRGRGISKALIEAAKSLCREWDSCGLILETDKINVVGNSLYPRCGFELDIEHNYYFWANSGGGPGAV